MHFFGCSHFFLQLPDQNFTLLFFLFQGQAVIERPELDQMNLCHYRGHLHGERSTTWTAISTCNGTIQGVIYDGEQLWHLHPVSLSPSESQNQGSHRLYQHSHQHDQNYTCGYQDAHAHPQQSNQPRQPRQPQRPRPKRDIVSKQPSSNDVLIEAELSEVDLQKSGGSLGLDGLDGLNDLDNNYDDGSSQPRKIPLRGPWNADKRSRYVELVLVVDHLEFVEHNSDLELVYRICKDVANVMNALYSPLNIYIALVGVVVWSEHDEINLSTDGDTTLKNFLHYRKERLVKEHPNDNAQLLTGIHFEGGVVGKALKGPICTYEFSGGVNMWHSDVVSFFCYSLKNSLIFLDFSKFSIFLLFLEKNSNFFCYYLKKSDFFIDFFRWG